MHTYGQFVTLDATLPAAVLADPRCPAAVRDTFAAFDAAQDATRAALAKVDEINDAAADNKAEIARAIREGKAKLPAAIDPAHTAARLAHAQAEVRACTGRAQVAARAAEASVPAHRAELRPIVLAPLAELAAQAERAAQEAANAYARARALTFAAADLDVAAAYREPDADRRRALAAIVGDHYAKVARQDAITHDGLSTRIDKAFIDVRTATAGIPVDAYAPDPLAAPDSAEAGRLVAEAEARAAQFRMPGDEPIKVGR
ncbi:hypothetical protein Q2K19_10580 [Micromonospora soli]|uniref:hypothetical protein n=1 Tax=Micromonospora sp. NBRC 110009 TaxID=3061627 RepID=UPI0026720020|nr:hypothetical protein [Micromonospora sp. NBRC 110009]WKU00883.1 hypothetical protein Q2K19_10580 [Micromonospora sp. NBRC 110009]